MFTKKIDKNYKVIFKTFFLKYAKTYFTKKLIQNIKDIYHDFFSYKKIDKNYKVIFKTFFLKYAKTYFTKKLNYIMSDISIIVIKIIINILKNVQTNYKFEIFLNKNCFQSICSC